MSDEESKNPNPLVAGHPKAVKAGGMRIVQHKTPNTERAGKDPVEVIGLSNPTPNIQGDNSVIQTTGATNKHDFVTDSQIAHNQKPAQTVPHKPVNNIQQPRKQ